MLNVIVSLIISIVGGIIADVIITAVKNKKNDRPQSGKLDGHSSNEE